MLIWLSLCYVFMLLYAGNDIMTDETLGVAEAKRRFSELIERVGRGERFVICRRGKPAVALVLWLESAR